MKILSWNINGIRASERKGLFEWLQHESPDILCLQETKAQKEQLTEKILSPDGYSSYWCSAEKKGYSGVCLYSRKVPESVTKGLGVKKLDSEGRTIIADFGKFVLFNVYFPNGGTGNKRVPFKMEFYDTFLKKINKFKKQGKNIIICGDVNTAHKEIDLARPKSNEKNTGFLPEERAWTTKLLSQGYIDTFRHFNKEPGNYSWWDYKTKARERNVGWRLDYFIISKNLLPKLKNAFIMKDIKGSDHCPVGITINIK